MKRFMKRASEKISKLSDEQIERILDALNDENDKFASILESISTGIIILDKDWSVLLTNKAAERYVPFTSAKDKKSVWELIADESIAAFLKKCRDDDKANASEEFSLQLFGSSAVRFVTVSLMPLVQKKGEKTLVTGSIVKIDDNTEKRKQDILLHRMESLASLTNLAANVAHEIKNPLGAISIHIQLLQKALKRARSSDGKLPEPKFMEERLDVVNEEIENLNKVIMDFLFAFSTLTDQFHIVAYTVNGQVASLSQGLEDVNLLIVNGKHTRTVHLTNHRNLIVCHAHCDYRVLFGIQIRQNSVVDHLFTLDLGQATHLKGTQHREFNGTIVANQIALESTVSTQTLINRTCIQGCRYDEVKGS